MIIKRIALLLITALLLFGCPAGGGGAKDETVSVTFDMDGGTPDFGTIEITKGSSLGHSYMYPVKEDFAFGGYYEINDVDFTTRYFYNTPINNNITLRARWGKAPASNVAFGNFTVPSKTSKANEGGFHDKTGVIKLSPTLTTDGYDWNVVSYNLESVYMNKEITITMDMYIWVSDNAKIVWQINSSTDSAAAAWGGKYKIIAGDDKTPLEKDAWIHLQGSATGTPTSGSGGGNQIYLSGGGSGGQLNSNPVDIYIADFSLTITDNSAITFPDSLKITIGQKKDLKDLLGADMTGTITWSSENPSIVSVTSDGIVTSNITSFSTTEGNAKYTSGAAKVLVTITASTASGKSQSFPVIATSEAQEHIATLTPLKEKFSSTFLVGNIASSIDADDTTITNQTLTKHFNALTPENEMKPSSLSKGDDKTAISYTYANADKLVNAAKESTIKVIGHTLLWHQQIPKWQTKIGTDAGDSPSAEYKAEAITQMKNYITAVVTHFKGKIYSWDVLNEAFPDKNASDWTTAIRPENPWFKAIGSDFVYEAYLAARLADPDAILYYNDYNTDQSYRADLIVNMVKAVNKKYSESGDKPSGEATGRLLIEGIGMQEHHNSGVQAANIRATLNKFKNLGVKVAVSELDVLAQSWGDFSGKDGANKVANSTVTNNGLLDQATKYAEYMAVYKDFIIDGTIERISFWGVTDNSSWRSAGLPLLFDSNGKAKPAYYKFVEAIPTTW